MAIRKISFIFFHSRFGVIEVVNTKVLLTTTIICECVFVISENSMLNSCLVGLVVANDTTEHDVLCSILRSDKSSVVARIVSDIWEQLFAINMGHVNVPIHRWLNFCITLRRLLG